MPPARRGRRAIDVEDEAVRKRKAARKRAERTGRQTDVKEWKRDLRGCSCYVGGSCLRDGPPGGGRNKGERNGK